MMAALSFIRAWAPVFGPWLGRIAIVAALAGAIWWINDAGYDRAMADRDKRDAALLDKMRSELRQTEQRLAGTVHGISVDLQQQDDAAQTYKTTIIQPTVEKELTREIRFVDPAAGITDSLREAINAARTSRACSTGASGDYVCTVPATKPAGR